MTDAKYMPVEINGRWLVMDATPDGRSPFDASRFRLMTDKEGIAERVAGELNYRRRHGTEVQNTGPV